jgi:hypothetical protein
MTTETLIMETETIEREVLNLSARLDKYIKVMQGHYGARSAPKELHDNLGTLAVNLAVLSNKAKGYADAVAVMRHGQELSSAEGNTTPVEQARDKWKPIKEGESVGSEWLIMLAVRFEEGRYTETNAKAVLQECLETPLTLTKGVPASYTIQKMEVCNEG